MLEGGDSSGKQTQYELLLPAIQAIHPVTPFDFPRYNESRSGRLLRRALNGDFGEFLELHPLISFALYALDRVGAKPKLKLALERGHVVCNRYVPSNIAHQSAKLPLEQRTEIIETLESIEYEELRLPKPDLVLYLHVPVHIARELLIKRIGPNAGDQHECNLEYQRRVNEVYFYLAHQRPEWRIIQCTENGVLRSREAIHALVWEQVFPVISS